MNVRSPDLQPESGAGWARSSRQNPSWRISTTSRPATPRFTSLRRSNSGPNSRRVTGLSESKSLPTTRLRGRNRGAGRRRRASLTHRPPDLPEPPYRVLDGKKTQLGSSGRWSRPRTGAPRRRRDAPRCPRPLDHPLGQVDAGHPRVLRTQLEVTNGAHTGRTCSWALQTARTWRVRPSISWASRTDRTGERSLCNRGRRAPPKRHPARELRVQRHARRCLGRWCARGSLDPCRQL